MCESVCERGGSHLASLSLLAAPLPQVSHAASLQLRVQLDVQRPLVEDTLNLHLTVPGQLERGGGGDGRWEEEEEVEMEGGEEEGGGDGRRRWRWEEVEGGDGRRRGGGGDGGWRESEQCCVTDIQYRERRRTVQASHKE